MCIICIIFVITQIEKEFPGYHFREGTKADGKTIYRLLEGAASDQGGLTYVNITSAGKKAWSFVSAEFGIKATTYAWPQNMKFHLLNILTIGSIPAVNSLRRFNKNLQMTVLQEIVVESIYQTNSYDFGIILFRRQWHLMKWKYVIFSIFKVTKIERSAFFFWGGGGDTRYKFHMGIRESLCKNYC